MLASANQSDHTMMRISKRTVFGCSVAAAVWLAWPACGAEPVAAPPFPGERSLYLLSLPFLQFGPFRPAEETGVDVSLMTANTFSHSWHPRAIKIEFGTLGQPFSRAEAAELHLRHPQDTIYFIDGDATRVSALATFSVGRGLSLGLEVPWISFDGPHTDSFIEGFHQTFGLGDSERPSFPRNRFQVVLQAPHGPLYFYDQTPTEGLGDIVTSLSWRKETAGRWRLAAQLALKLPTGDADQLRGSGSFDGGLLVAVAKGLGETERWTLRLEGSVVVPGPYRGSMPIGLDPSVFVRVLLGAQIRIGSSTWVSLGTAVEQSPFRKDNLLDVAQTAASVNLGISQRLFQRGLAEIWVTEHLPRYGDSADVGFGFRLRYLPGR